MIPHHTAKHFWGITNLIKGINVCVNNSIKLIFKLNPHFTITNNETNFLILSSKTVRGWTEGQKDIQLSEVIISYLITSCGRI